MNNLRDKMLNYQVPPPAGVWNRVADALEESEQGLLFPKNLQQMEATPPAAAWDRIVNALDEAATPEPVKPLFLRLPQLVKYAAAVIVIALAAYGVIKLGGGDTDDPVNTMAGNQNNSLPATAAPAIKSDAVSANSAPAGINSNNLQEAGNNHSRLARSGNTESVATGAIASSHNISRAIYTYSDHIPPVADRYITLLTPDGSFIRMSKKWSNLLCCVAGEEQDSDCKNQLKEWQDKLAESSILSAPGNFMDIVSLVNSLN